MPWRLLLLTWTMLLVLAGCATQAAWRKPPEEYARPPQADSRFAPIEQRIAERHGAEASGFTLLERASNKGAGSQYSRP